MPNPLLPASSRPFLSARGLGRPAFPPLLLFATLALLFFRAAEAGPAARDRVTWLSAHFELTIARKKAHALPELAALCEALYARQQAFYGVEPFPARTPKSKRRLQMVFLDEDDIANGYAVSHMNWIGIYLPGAQFELRGRTRWLPNVIAHEMAHIFTLRMMGVTSKFLGFGLSYDRFEADRDQYQASLFYPTDQVPAWLAEGLAQYGAQHCGYERFDSHRAMVLRVAAQHGDLLPLPEMETFSADARHSEMVYIQGYSWVSHLYEKFGAEAMNRMLRLSADKGYRRAFQEVFGASQADLYEDWHRSVPSRYRLRAASDSVLNAADSGASPPSRPVPASQRRREIPPPPNIPYLVETSPLSPIGNQLFFASSRRNDYGQTDLFVAEGAEGRSRRARRVFENLTSRPLADEKGQYVYFCSRQLHAQDRTFISDAYRYNPRTYRVERLTRNRRLFALAPVPGGRLFGLQEEAGKTFFVEIENSPLRLGEDTRILSRTLPPKGFEYRDLVPGPDSGHLYVSYAAGDNSDIGLLETATGRLTPLLHSNKDERDPFWHEGRLYFVGDYEGAFFLYSFDGTRIREEARSEGGIFTPSASRGRLFFSEYGREGFGLFSIARDTGLPVSDTAPGQATTAPGLVTVAAPELYPASASLSQPYVAPAPVEIVKNRSDLSRTQWLGFGLQGRVVRYPGIEMEHFPGAELNEGGDYETTPTHSLSLGAFNLWQDPSGDHSLSLFTELSQIFSQESDSAVPGPWLSSLQFSYSTSLLRPIFAVFLGYESLVLGSVQEKTVPPGWNSYPLSENTHPSIHQFILGAQSRHALTPHLSWSNAAAAAIVSYSLDYDTNTAWTGANFQAATDLDYQNVEMGTDFPLSGPVLSGGVRFIPIAEEQVFIFSTTGMGFAHLNRLLFLEAGTGVNQYVGPLTVTALFGFARLSSSIPLKLRVGPAPGRRIYFDSFQPFVDAFGFYDTFRSTRQNGPNWSPSFPIEMARSQREEAKRSTSPKQSIPQARQMLSFPYGLTAGTDPEYFSLGFTLKTLGAFQQLSYWTLEMGITSPEIWQDAVWRFSITL